MSLNVIYLSKFPSKRESNCNIIKSHYQSRDEFNPIEIISYLSKINLSLVMHHLTYLIFSVNFHDQTFKSTYTINLFNQPILNR